MSCETPSFIPITRPHLPAREEFTAIVEELFDTRMLSNFSKYSRRYRLALESCVGLVWQNVLPGCVHGYKDLAVEFLTAEHRSAAETALAAVGVMTKR